MKLIYLASTQNDLQWFHQYYSQVFPEGAKKALQQFDLMESLLSENPYLGRIHEEATRKLATPNTPFSYIYRVNNECIEILRVWDDRQKI